MMFTARHEDFRVEQCGRRIDRNVCFRQKAATAMWNHSVRHEFQIGVGSHVDVLYLSGEVRIHTVNLRGGLCRDVRAGALGSVDL